MKLPYSRITKCIALLVLLSSVFVFMIWIVRAQFRNTDTLVNKLACRMFELNEIRVEAKGKIDPGHVELRQYSEVLYANGHQKGKMIQEYGGSYLLIFYKGRLISEFGHFRRNNWYTNDYNITLAGEEESIDLDIEIDGPDSSNDAFLKRFYEDRVEYQTLDGNVYNVNYTSD